MSALLVEGELASACAKVFRNRHCLSYKASSNKLFIKVHKTIAWIQLTDVLWIGDVDDYSLVDEQTIKMLKRLAALLGYNTIRFHFNDSPLLPHFLKQFTNHAQEPLCIGYLNDQLQPCNLLLTAADFDTW